MRRFSQRNSFVTLSEINITPLLDLAFVLLIIFVITHPMIEQSMRLNLPSAGRQRNSKPDPKDIQTVEISQSGEMRMAGQKMSVSQIEAELAQKHLSNPNLAVVIRADKSAPTDFPVQVLGVCGRVGITQFLIKIAPAK